MPFGRTYHEFQEFFGLVLVVRLPDGFLQASSRPKLGNGTGWYLDGLIGILRIYPCPGVMVTDVKLPERTNRGSVGTTARRPVGYNGR